MSNLTGREVLEERVEPAAVISDVLFASPKRAGNKYRVIVTDEMDEYDKPVSRDVLLKTSAALLAAPGGDDFTGKARKAAKISIADAPVEEFEDLRDLIETLPSTAEMVDHDPPITLDKTSDRVEEERRNVRLRVFLYAASRENDNDFHLILGRAAGESPKMYLTMELSGLPPEDSPHFETLKAARDAYKEFFGDNLPGTAYQHYIPPIPVEIEGSLFFDMNHAQGSRPGPQNLRPHMPTVWEVHPISSIIFEP